MSQALVQTGAEIVVSGGTSGSVTLNGVAAGNLLTANCINDSSPTATFSVSDNRGDTWQTAVSHGAVPPTGVVAILYAANVTGGNTTVTVQSSASSAFNALVREWSGSATSSPVAATDTFTDSANGTSHKASSSGINPATPCICIVGGVTSQPAGTRTPGTGYTGTTSSSLYDFYEYQIFSSAPTNEQGKWTNANSVIGLSVIAAFQPPSGPHSLAIAGQAGDYPRYTAVPNHCPKLTAAARTTPHLSGTSQCST